MTKLRTSWENELNDFIVKIDESFSAAFESMGCAGEVRIGLFLSSLLASDIILTRIYRATRRLRSMGCGNLCQI